MPIPVSNAATVTMTIDDFRKAEAELDSLREQVKALSMRPVTSNTVTDARLTAAFSSAMEVVRFAVGNLNPESYRGWPTEALEQLAQAIDELYPDDPNWQSTAIAFRELAGDAIEADTIRVRREEAAEAVATAIAQSGGESS